MLKVFWTFWSLQRMCSMGLQCDFMSTGGVKLICIKTATFPHVPLNKLHPQCFYWLRLITGKFNQHLPVVEIKIAWLALVILHLFLYFYYFCSWRNFYLATLFTIDKMDFSYLENFIVNKFGKFSMLKPCSGECLIKILRQL